MNFLTILCICSAAVVATPVKCTLQTDSTKILADSTSQQSNLGHLLQPPSIQYNQPELNNYYTDNYQQYQRKFQYEVQEQQQQQHQQQQQQQQLYQQPYVSSNFITNPYYKSPLNVQSVPLVTKDIFVHAAPEETEEQLVHAELNTPKVPRKHYRIIFIKAPKPQVNKAALNIKEAPTEEKTVIYVLSKKADPVQLEAAYQETSTEPSKPEVHFIKYKTKEEAELAQKHIQAHYDKLGGTTRFKDEGIAPLYSIESSLSSSALQSTNSAKSASSSYNSDSVSSSYNPKTISSSYNSDLESVPYNFKSTRSVSNSNLQSSTYNSKYAHLEPENIKKKLQ